MAAPAGRKNERSFLLGGASLSNNPERNVGDISSNTSTPSPPTRRSALTQLAQQRLGSMRWLMSRDVTISPPPPRAQGSPQQSRSVDPASGVYSAGDVRDRGPVRRSASAEADGVGGHPAAAGSRNSRLGGGLFSSGSGHKTRSDMRQQLQTRPQGGGTGSRSSITRNSYRISIELERPPTGSSVWVKGRRSSLRATRSGPQSTAQHEGTPDTDVAGQRALRNGALGFDDDEVDDDADDMDDGSIADRQAMDRRKRLTAGFLAGAVVIVWTAALGAVVKGWVALAAGFALAGLLLLLALMILIGEGQAFRWWMGGGDLKSGEDRGEESECLEAGAAVTGGIPHLTI